VTLLKNLKAHYQAWKTRKKVAFWYIVALIVISSIVFPVMVTIWMMGAAIIGIFFAFAMLIDP
jgi:hypothetical protein